MNDRDYQDYLDSLPDDILAQIESDYYEYERYLHGTGQAFDELPF